MRMWILSFILLFFPQPLATSSLNSKAICQTGGIAECQKAMFVPGHTLLGDGFDIVTMKPTGSFPLDMQDINKHKCKLCQNPHNNNVLQKLPRSMVSWNPLVLCPRNVNSAAYKTMVSLAKEATLMVKNDWKSGLDVDIPPKDTGTVVKTLVGGSRSDLAKYAVRMSRSDQYSFLSHKLECSYYSFSASNFSTLTKHFKQSLTKLPALYNNKSQAEYRRLIARYGTHYIAQAEVGGRIHEVTAVRTCEVAMDGVKVSEVKDCLSMEAQLSAKGGNASTINNEKVTRCAKIAKQGKNFHQMFSERWWKVNGGNETYDLLSGKKGSRLFDKWLESLKTQPGLVSISLKPIYELVKVEGRQKDNLRYAIGEYIKENAVIKNCSCSGRPFLSLHGDCSCVCKPSKYINPDCCPKQRGRAKLHVTVLRGEGLWGDYITQTDAYVKLKFDSSKAVAETIWNNNNPRWNETFALGTVKLSDKKKLTVEVWDEDNKYDDDLLGKCEETVATGNVSRICYLNYGSLTYSVTARCLSYLQGRYCQDYKPSPP